MHLGAEFRAGGMCSQWDISYRGLTSTVYAQPRANIKMVSSTLKSGSIVRKSTV